MARISGITIPSEKQVKYSLTYVYGIGEKTSESILEKCGIDPTIRVKDLTDGDISKIQEVIDKNHTVEGELQRIVTTNIKRLKDINSYRGLRHKKNLPVRGQRTRTNGRTKRGRRVAIGGVKPKSAAKT